MLVSAKFSIGQRVHHKRFDYRGVIVDVDPEFGGSDEWYDTMADSRPPKNRPWYRLLVHESDQLTYVAERNLEDDSSEEPIEHPLVDSLFSRYENGVYVMRQTSN